MSSITPYLRQGESSNKLVMTDRPLLLGGHVESQKNKKLYFCTANLALNSRLGEACRTKAKPFYSSETQHGLAIP